MPHFGAHFSVAGGLSRAVDLCVTHGTDAVQIFTKNASQWAGKPLTPAECDAFRGAVARAGVKVTAAHDSYLINLASPDEALYEKSVAAFADEIRRADLLGLDYLVTHPGAHVGSGEDTALGRAVDGFDAALALVPDARVTVLLETTAGQGTCLGAPFEHLAFILTTVRRPERFGVCFDTCHAFAAGYDLRTAAGYAAVFEEFDRVVGLDQLKMFHVNDSAKPLGSRVDRHAGIGLGEIGDDAFRLLSADPRFADRAMVLETPKEDDDGNPMDAVNLAKLRAFAAGAAGRPAMTTGSR